MDRSRSGKIFARKKAIIRSHAGLTEEKKAEALAIKGDYFRQASEEECVVVPRLFQHHDLIHALESSSSVDMRSLINRFNHIHFMDGNVLVHLSYENSQDTILVTARPEPCLDGELICHWSDEKLLNFSIDKYQFLHLIIDDGQSMTVVPAVLQEMTSKYVKVQLPDVSYEIGQRRARRHTCHDVDVELDQSGFFAKGELLDFSPVGFRIRVLPDSYSSFNWFNADELVRVHLRNHKQIFFSGICRCIRQQEKFQDNEIVLALADENSSRFRPNSTRNPRQHLASSPALSFEHPFLNKKVQLEVADISTSGFSVYEKADEGVLIPGMIIPELVVSFAGSLKMNCVVQVIYRTKEDKQRLRCGLAILDMDIDNYSRLTDILTNALDPHACVSREIDMDALWEFFFSAGFMYPKKYRLIQSHREHFKKMYKKLYLESQDIARHFTYQKNGRIYGHISMVRAYERTWMIHHHAALTMENKRSGFFVLKQIMHYLNDMHRLPSAKMDYVISYFRPENKFPDRVFGGFARDLRNLRGCSMDLFASLPYTSLSLDTGFAESWSLRECSALDLWELNRIYGHGSGGLLLDAMDLNQKDSGNGSLEKVYARFGFLRKQKSYALAYDNELSAVLVVDQSELGFNFSELTNGIKVLVTNPDSLPWRVLSIAISRLTNVYHMDRIPILFYPFEYVESESIPYEKKYQAWVLNVRYGNEYMEYMQRKFKVGYR
jgi:hypothetical protein